MSSRKPVLDLADRLGEHRSRRRVLGLAAKITGGVTAAGITGTTKQALGYACTSWGDCQLQFSTRCTPSALRGGLHTLGPVASMGAPSYVAIVSAAARRDAHFLGQTEQAAEVAGETAMLGSLGRPDE